MGKLSIFDEGDREVRLTSEGGETLDSLITAQKNILDELKLTRKGHEEGLWGEEVEDNDNINLSNVIIEEELDA